MMHQPFLSILSTLIILSNGLPWFVSALRLTHTQAVAPTSPPPNPSALDITLPPSPPTSNYASNLTAWPALPIDIDIVPGRATLTILNLTPIQDYHTIEANVKGAYDTIAAGGPPEDHLPPNLRVWEGRLTAYFFSTNLERGIVLQVLRTVGTWEALHGAAELQRAALVIDGKQGGFTLRTARVAAAGLDEGTKFTTSRRSLPSTNKHSVIFSLDSLPQNLTIDEPSANLTAWPSPPIFLRIDSIHLFLNITAIAPAQPPYVPVLASIQGIMLELESTEEPPSAQLPEVILTQYFGRVSVCWYSAIPRMITYGMALRVMETVLELELGHGIQQLLNADIKVRWQIWGHFSLVISDYDDDLSPAPNLNLTQEGNGVMMKNKKREDRRWPPTPIIRILSPHLSIYISLISAGTPPYDTIIEDIIALQNELNTYGPPETVLDVHTYLASGRVEIFFTDAVPNSLTVGIAAEVLDELLDLETEYGPQQLDEADILVQGEMVASFSLEFIDPERVGAYRTALVSGIEVGRQATE